MIDRKVFFDIARKRLFGNTLTQGQVAGIDAVLDEWEKRKLTDLRWLAYMLATDKHETNATMLAVREAYWLSEEWRKAHLRYWPYYGRGLVQLTWRENYDKMGKFLNLPLADNPDLALDLGAAVQVMFEGMLKAETGVGDFTGRCLEQFFNDQKDDPVGARTIINGTDKAQLIAGYHHDFLTALKAATERKAA
jgi:putative chitinase